MTPIPKRPVKVGLAGVGAIGSAVARALQKGMADMELHALSDPAAKDNFAIQNVDFDTLVHSCDLIVEALPAHIVPELATKIFQSGKDAVFISSAALLLYPDILKTQKESNSRIYVPSGALCGLDGVKAMKEMGIKSSKIASTKPPKGLAGAPFIVDNNIDLGTIKEKTQLFEGNAFEAAKGFPANVNVAATLSLAGIGPDETRVEVWADPAAKGNAHEITVKSAYSTLTTRIENMPDPANPKSSVLAAQSIVACLKDMNSAIKIG